MAIIKLFDKDGNEYGLSADFKKFYLPQYVLKEEEIETTKYVIIKKDTICFETIERNTTKYNTQEELTIKYVPREVEVEKPVIRKVNLDVPNKSSLEMIRESIDVIVECIKLLPELLTNLRLLVDCAKDIPKIRHEFSAMKRMIEGYQRPIFKEIEVLNPIFKDKVIFKPIFKDVEIINPVIRNKPMTAEEAKKYAEECEDKADD